jgi:hypothetical protein
MTLQKAIERMTEVCPGRHCCIEVKAAKYFPSIESIPPHTDITITAYNEDHGHFYGPTIESAVEQLVQKAVASKLTACMADAEEAAKEAQDQHTVLAPDELAKLAEKEGDL